MPIAKKDYDCDACEWLSASIGDFNMTYQEAKQYIKAKRNGFMIKKGQLYKKQFMKADGEVYTFRAIPEIHNICLKYDLYE